MEKTCVGYVICFLVPVICIGQLLLNVCILLLGKIYALLAIYQFALVCSKPYCVV